MKSKEFIVKKVLRKTKIAYKVLEKKHRAKYGFWGRYKGEEEYYKYHGKERLSIDPYGFDSCIYIDPFKFKTKGEAVKYINNFCKIEKCNIGIKYE